MIWITGDTHGNFSRFATRTFPQQKKMTKEDCVLICGDFGGLWDGGPEDRYWLDWLERKPFTTLFVEGNHSNHDLLRALPVEPWNGGRIHRVRPSVLHLMRGQVFTLEGRRFFTMGGASSHDMPGGVLRREDPDYQRRRQRLERQRIPYRVEHLSWWKEELPTPEEYGEAERNLSANDWQVDYVVTHCAPTPLQERMGKGYPADALTDYLDGLTRRLRFTRWYFGHYHGDWEVDDKYRLIYRDIVPLDGGADDQ